MAIKKSELYSTLWASCDELRGSMDASQYKDYVLFMLFVKYISDKYANVPYAPIKIPKGATFQDMVLLKGLTTIGDNINTKIVEPIARENNLSSLPDFNDPVKLGSGADMVTKLTNLISIFENPALDFSNNRADGDDILGGAYEFLMKHFATESGKSKGQFYTPAEVSRVMAKVIGINSKNTIASTSVYDPTCGSGSLLLKVADESEKAISVFGQENDASTAGLARMNMILHNTPAAEIKQGNTLANPLFKDEQGRLKTFDYVVANPPFSYKSWSNGLNIIEEQQSGGRFYGYGVPPNKNGDYAFLLHVVKSLKSKGKGAIILPHGVLFRGNAEAEMRKNLIHKGIIKGVIGLPANLFYGTGIPACLIILDKENADNRKGIFMIDASKGFVKDGNKNRLREQDLHKIVDVFNKQLELPKYSRMVSVVEIEKNEFNLNIPRYIDSQEIEDIQNIEAHLLGDIPNADINALENYWKAYPTLKNVLFGKSQRNNYCKLKIADDEIKNTIFSHSEFIDYTKKVNDVFIKWRNKNITLLKNLSVGAKPKKLIHQLSEDLLQHFANLNLIDNYDVYQQLMSFWMETMQDDAYIISSIGWVDGVRLREIFQRKNENNKLIWTETHDITLGKRRFKSELIPSKLIVNKYFTSNYNALLKIVENSEAITSQITEMEEEHGGDEGLFAEFDKVNKANVQKRLKDIKNDVDADEERLVLEAYLKLTEQQTEANKKIKEAIADLDKKVIERYKTLIEDEIKQLVVDDKWMTEIERSVKTEMERISQRLTQRIKELAERYETPLPKQTTDVADLENKVSAHLQKMGFVWN